MTVLKEHVNKSDNLYEDEQTKDLMNRSLQYLKAGYPVHFTGPTGSGKTSYALALAKKRKRPVMLIHGNHELDNKDLIGDFTGYTSKKVIDQYVRSVYKKDETVTEAWKDGRLLQAVKEGYTLVYDEFTRSMPTTNNLFLSILEEGVLPLYGMKLTQPFCKVHPEFSVIFTSNPAEYAGVYKTQDALLDRLVTIPIRYKTKEQETGILIQKLGMEQDDAEMITKLVSTLRMSCANADEGPSLRASIMIAKVALEEDIPIESNSKEFQQLCLDVLLHPMSQCMDTNDPLEDAEKQIIQECKKL